MAHVNISHRRTHNLLLISKLLNQRDGASPFTLVLDSLEQLARPLLKEYIRRAKLSQCLTIFLSFETVRKPDGIDTFIACYGLGPAQIAEEVRRVVGPAQPTAPNQRFLIIVDSLTILAAWSTDQETRFNLTEYLSFLIASQVQTTQAQTSLVAVLHTDVPVSNASTPYSPRPLALLSYLATSIITVHSLPNLLATREARARSSAEPVFGLEEEIEGVVIGVNPWAKCPRRDEEGVVLELEHRRKSGRGVLEWYFMPRTSRPRPIAAHPFKERVILLDDHPLYRLKPNEETADPELASLTFDIGLTQRQREQREGVVLPYFDAQKAEGGGEGGRILYDMGVEDDFDEEEDEM